MGALLGLLSLGGCRGELLDPGECEYLAERAAGVTSSLQLRNPRIRKEVLERTERCLLTPYDRRYVQCLAQVGRFDACEADLLRRVRSARDSFFNSQ